MPFTYISPHSTLGMLSKRYKLLDNYEGFIKNKNELNVFSIHHIEKYKNLRSKIGLGYIKEPDFKLIKSSNKILSKYTSDQIVSKFDKDFFQLSGKKWKEIREAKNHYSKLTYSTNIPNSIEEVYEFIKYWKTNRGLIKYGWQDHSGYDINFFENYYKKEKDNLHCTFLYDKISNELLGYSVISKIPNDKCYNYLIRKSDWKQRNLCLYLDYISFEKMFSILNSDFYINWGCSKGTLKKYKLKFPVYDIETHYFFKINGSI